MNRDQAAQDAAELRRLRQELAHKDAEHAALVEAHGELLRQRAARLARVETALRDQQEALARQAGELDALEARLHAQAAEAEGRLQAVLASSSWRLTQPLRGIAERGAAVLAKFRRAPGQDR